MTEKSLNAIKKWAKDFKIDLPDDENIPEIESLNLRGKKIDYIPDEICDFSKLRFLSLCDNFISDLPTLPGSLEYISVEKNILSSIPDSVLLLPNLLYIDASNNKIMDLSNLRGNKILRGLNLSNNSIEDASVLFEKENTIDFLNLNGNYIGDIVLGEKSFKSLGVSFNRIEKITIGGNHRSYIIDLRGNKKLHKIPKRSFFLAYFFCVECRNLSELFFASLASLRFTFFRRNGVNKYIEEFDSVFGQTCSFLKQ